MAKRSQQGLEQPGSHPASLVDSCNAHRRPYTPQGSTALFSTAPPPENPPSYNNWAFRWLWISLSTFPLPSNSHVKRRAPQLQRRAWQRTRGSPPWSVQPLHLQSVDSTRNVHGKERRSEEVGLEEQVFFSTTSTTNRQQQHTLQHISTHLLSSFPVL